MMMEVAMPDQNETGASCHNFRRFDEPGNVDEGWCCVRGPQCASKVCFRSKTGPHLLNVSFSHFDVVDGAHSAASKCHRVVRSKRNHIEGNRPWARLARSVWISPRICFKFTVSMLKARW